MGFVVGVEGVNEVEGVEVGVGEGVGIGVDDDVGLKEGEFLKTKLRTKKIKIKRN
jgi:hypothetical protein